MNICKRFFWVLGLLTLVVGCTGDEPSFDKTTCSDEEYVRINLVGGCGHNAASEDTELTRVVWEDALGCGDLLLKWEQGDELAFVVSDGEKPIVGRVSPESDATATYGTLAVTPQDGDAYHAYFESSLYYNSEELQSAKYCYAVAGNREVEERASEGLHICHSDMPSAFTQRASQEPDFLRNYMCAYAVATYKGGNTALNFKHIPATFRFVVGNSTTRDIAVEQLSVSVASGGDVASKSASVEFDWKRGAAEVLFGKGGHDKVAVNIPNGVVPAGDEYTAYALAMPLSKDNALKDKTLNFSVKCDGEEQVALQLDAEKLAELNGNNRYNWVSGKSYTIRVTIREDKKATGEILDENRIEVKPTESGIYTLLYEGADGQPLSDYAEICTLTAKELAYYEEFIDVNVAPRTAKVIGIYNSANERQGYIPLGNFKPNFNKEPLYSFGLLSDVHIGRSVINPETDFERALKFFNAKGVAHTCICGDITQNGKEAEYQSWANVAALADAPIYTVTGNHDATSGGITPDLWVKYTGLPLVFERSVERDGKTDHFLFLGMERWNFSSAYLDYHLLWLEDRLEEYRNERCFVITHLFFPERAGNLNNIYPSGNWLKGEQLEQLEAMCDRYVNSIWFSGHSHWEWQLQKYQDRANIYRTYNAALLPTSGWCVHVPSCGVPITSDGSTRVDNTEGSEGAVIEVYEDYIVILGVDFASGKYLPIATYCLDTTLQTVTKSTTTRPSYYITASNFTENAKKKGATVKDVEGMPNYVEVTFNAKSQGFYISNESFSSSTTEASITIEDVQAFSNGVAVDIPAGVGFYGTSGYYLVSTNSAEVKPDSYTGVQFQTSGSKYGDGPLPLTLRIKAQMKFY